MNLKKLLVVLSLLTLLVGGCSLSQESPPEREFDQAESFLLLEKIVTDTIAVLPDFPGFGKRRYMPVEDCSHLGEQYEGWVAIEIRYVFTGDTSQSDLVRLEYPELLRQLWADAGYDIHRDEIDADGVGAIEAERSDGINLWWEASPEGGVALTLQTGCIPGTPGFDKPDYIPPAGNVPPGGDLALLGGAMKTPAESEDSTPAIDPFASASETPDSD